MPEITATLVKELREATNLGMMECKRALVEAEGDKDAAVRLLRERGLAIAQKKSSREVNQGMIETCASDDQKTASLVELNCETDFVTRNDIFIAFVKELAQRACETDGALADEAKDALTAKVAEIGENMVIRRNVRYVSEGTGTVASYVHPGGRVGVLVEIACEKDETLANDAFAAAVKDVTMHIAACSPTYLDKGDVPADVLQAEREIFAKQVEGKPENIVDKIVDGKVNKYYGQICLVLQGFVKEPKETVTQHLDNIGKEIGDKISIRRFARYELGQD